MSLPADVWSVICQSIPLSDQSSLSQVCKVTAAGVQHHHKQYFTEVHGLFHRAVNAMKCKTEFSRQWHSSRKLANITNTMVTKYHKYYKQLKAMAPTAIRIPDSVAHIIHLRYRINSWWTVLAPLLFAVILNKCWYSTYTSNQCVTTKYFKRPFKCKVINVPYCGVCYSMPELVVEDRMWYQCGSIVHAKSFYMCSDCADSIFNVMYYGCHCWQQRKEACHRHCKHGTGYCN